MAWTGTGSPAGTSRAAARRSRPAAVAVGAATSTAHRSPNSRWMAWANARFAPTVYEWPSESMRSGRAIGSYVPRFEVGRAGKDANTAALSGCRQTAAVFLARIEVAGNFGESGLARSDISA